MRHELPAGEYIVCSIEAENFDELVMVALDQAGKYLFGTWLPKHNLSTKPFLAEKYYVALQESPYLEMWVSPIEK